MSSIQLYPTYQVFLAFLLSGAITLLILPFFIRLLRYRQIGQQVRADGPQGHLVKQGTPTMGGVVMLFAVGITVAILGNETPQVVLCLIATLVTGLLGFVDDVSKVAHARSLGLTPKAKIISQTVISVLFCLFAVNWVGIEPVITFPFPHVTWDLGILSTTVNLFGCDIVFPWLYIVFIFLLMAGMSNAVNLTDGLDGLAAGTVMFVMLVMAAIAFRSDMVSVAMFSAGCAGACVGFIWFNCYPADIFMGDTGSLALGTAFAAIAVVTKTEVFSLIIGGLFIIEALSVMIQVVHFKRTGKRVFLMAPLHHHFEKKGWKESRVVIRFWIISAAFAGIGFALYFWQSI